VGRNLRLDGENLFRFQGADCASPVECPLHFQGGDMIQVTLQHRPFCAEQLVDPVSSATEQAGEVFLGFFRI